MTGSRPARGLALSRKAAVYSVLISTNSATPQMGRDVPFQFQPKKDVDNQNALSMMVPRILGNPNPGVISLPATRFCIVAGNVELGLKAGALLTDSEARRVPSPRPAANDPRVIYRESHAKRV